MDVFEIVVGTFPNQSFATSINGVDYYFDLLTFGDQLMMNLSNDTEEVFSGYRLPIGTPILVNTLEGYLLFDGSYNWETLNITSFLYYIPSSSIA